MDVEARKKERNRNEAHRFRVKDKEHLMKLYEIINKKNINRSALIEIVLNHFKNIPEAILEI